MLREGLLLLLFFFFVFLCFCLEGLVGGVQKGAGCGRGREVGWRHDILTAYDIVAAMTCYSILFAEKNNQQRSSSKKRERNKSSTFIYLHR